MLLAGGFWAHGTSGAAAIGPVLGGLAVLSFGGLVARLAGPQWAPAAPLVLGLTLPEQYVSRAAFTEPAVQVLLFGGLCLLTDALTLRAGPPVLLAAWRRMAPARSWPGRSWPERSWPGRSWSARSWSGPSSPGAFTPERTMAALAGLALGLGLLVSLDALACLLPVIPFGGLLLATRRPGAAPFCWGVGLGAGYGLVDGYVLSRPFMSALSHPLALAGFIAAWLLALTFATVQLLRVPAAREWLARQAARWPARWLPAAASLVAVAALVGLAVRPYLQQAHDAPGLAVFRFIAGLQRAQGLPVDPTRTYAESTLYWVIWYVGLPAVLLGGFGIALLARSCVRALLTGRDPSGAWQKLGAAARHHLRRLGRRAVEPRHPAGPAVGQPPPGDRRAARPDRLRAVGVGVADRACPDARCPARDRGPGRAVLRGRPGPADGGHRVRRRPQPFGALGKPGRERLRAGGPADRRRGDRRRRAAVCGHPAGRLRGYPRLVGGPALHPGHPGHVRRPGRVDDRGAPGGGDRRAGRDRPAGRRPVLLGARRAQLDGFGSTPVRVLDLFTTQDPHELTRPPTALASIRFVVWMVAPRPGGTGA